MSPTVLASLCYYFFLSLSFIPPVRRFAPAPDGSVAAAAIATSSAYCCQYYDDDDYCYLRPLRLQWLLLQPRLLSPLPPGHGTSKCVYPGAVGWIDHSRTLHPRILESLAVEGKEHRDVVRRDRLGALGVCGHLPAGCGVKAQSMASGLRVVSL